MKKGILHYVSALNKYGSISAAATHCNVSYSTLSSSLQRMEAELGCPLFDRTQYCLTMEGLVYANAAEEILKEDENLRNIFQKMQTSTIRFRSAEYIDRNLISQFSLLLLTKSPLNRLQTSWNSANNGLSDLLENRCDVLLSTDTASPSSQLTFLPLMRASMQLLVPDETVVSSSNPLTSAGHLKMIPMFPDSPIYSLQSNLIMRAGISPEILMETNSHILVNSLVKEGAGFAIVDSLNAQSMPQCNAYPIPNSDITIGLWYLHEKEQLEVFQTTCLCLKQTVSTLYGSNPDVVLLFDAKEY